MSDPALFRSAPRPLPARRLAPRGSAHAPKIAGFEDRFLRAWARIVTRGPTEDCVGSQIARPSVRASIPATRRSAAVCRRKSSRGKGSFSGQVVRHAARSRRPAKAVNLPRARSRKFSGSQRVENNRSVEIIASGIERSAAQNRWPDAAVASDPHHQPRRASGVLGHTRRVGARKIDEENFPACNTLKTIDPEKCSRRFGASSKGETPCASPTRRQRLQPMKMVGVAVARRSGRA
jgi:hypothetical protein